MNREAIYQTLFATLQGAVVPAGIVTSSRKLKHWDDVSPGELPAMFQAQGAEQAIVKTGLPTRWLLDATIWLYVNTDQVPVPSSVINPIVDAVTNTLAFSPLGRQTLGGLVEYARIEGRIETSEGTLGNREVARIPVSILLAE